MSEQGRVQSERENCITVLTSDRLTFPANLSFHIHIFFVSCVVRRIWFGDMNIDVGHDDVKCVDDCKDSNICKFSGSHSKYDRKNKIILTAIHI